MTLHLNFDPLPKQCKIFGNTIDIVRKTVVLDDDGLAVNGTYEAEKDRIEISTEQSLDKQWQTLLHELYHAVLHYCGKTDLDEDEAHIEMTSQVVFQIIKTLN